MTARPIRSTHPMITHVAAVRERVAPLPPRLRARLPKRRVTPTKLALGHLAFKSGTVLLLIDERNGAEEWEVHDSVARAIGQAELEFGLPPSEWREAEKH